MKAWNCVSVIFLFGIISVLFNVQNDCDEAFNYWEPLHLLVTGKESFQTWEYSPDYALRSYLYLIVFGWPAKVINIFFASSLFSYVCVRLFLILCSIASLITLCKSLNEFHMYIRPINMHVPLYLIFIMMYVTTPAYFISASNFTPSAVSSSVTALYIAFIIKSNYFMSIGCIAFASIYLWPFCALLGLCIIFMMFLRRKVYQLLIYTFLWGVFLSIPTLLVDSYYYGKFSLPCLNILKYNVFGAFFYNGTSSTLYGIEPISFYLKNLFINFNIIVVAMVILTPVMLFSFIYCFIKDKMEPILHLYLLNLMLIILWCGVFFLQPHKEERFLFPIYPCISLTTAISIMHFSNLTTKWTNSKAIDYMKCMKFIVFFTLMLSLNLSRIGAIVNGYSAPLHLLKNLKPLNMNISYTLCLGRDWHHFPNRFLLDSKISSVRFIKSSFKGQLPAHYVLTNSIKDSTVLNGGKFNLFNKEETDRFLNEPLEDYCHFVLDRREPTNKGEILFAENTTYWGVLDRSKIIAAKNFGLESSLRRAFYFPNKPCLEYVDMELYFNKKIFKKGVYSAAK